MTVYYGDTKAGTPTITAASTGLTSATQVETIAVGAVAAFTLSTPSPTVGTAFNETVTAVDAGGNKVTTFLGTNCLTFSGPSNSPNGTAPAYPASGTCSSNSSGLSGSSGSSVTFTAGVGTASITLTDAQSTTLTATDALITGTSASFTVSAGSASAFNLATPTATAGSTFNETITATDGYGNTVTSYAGTKCLTFSGPLSSPNHTAPTYPARGTCATGSSAVTFATGSGTAAITLTDAQSTELTGTAGTMTGTSTQFTVSSGPMATLAVATPGSQTAGTAFTTTITAFDAYGNAFNGTLSPAFSNPASSPNGTAPNYPSSVTFANGGTTPSITLTDAQSTTLKVTAAGVSATSGSFTVIPASASTLTATSGANQSANVNTAFTNKLVATATDTYGNALSGLVVTFAAPSTGASGTFAYVRLQPAELLVHGDHRRHWASHVIDLHGQWDSRRLQHHGLHWRTHGNLR